MSARRFCGHHDVKRIAFAGVLGLALVGQVSGAELYDLNGTQVLVDYWAGAGAQETVLVVDWNETNGPYLTESHAFGFRWDGTAFLSDALSAIAAAGALDYTTLFGGEFVEHVQYFDASIDADQHTSAGWGGWWWLGETADGGATWTLNGDGLTTEELHSGSIEGLNLDEDNWTSTTLTIPVPEPSAIVIVAVAVCLRRRRALRHRRTGFQPVSHPFGRAEILRCGRRYSSPRARG